MSITAGLTLLVAQSLAAGRASPTPNEILAHTPSLRLPMPERAAALRIVRANMLHEIEATPPAPPKPSRRVALTLLGAGNAKVLFGVRHDVRLGLGFKFLF